MQQSEIKKSRAVAGIRFCLLSQPQIVESLLAPMPKQPLRLVVTTNVDHMVIMRRHSAFKQACANAWLVTADGFPVVRLLKLLGIAIPGRITGADLFPAILSKLTPEQHAPFFVCANNTTARFLTRWLAAQGYSEPERRVVVPEFGFDTDAMRSYALVQQIVNVGTSHLFFGVGAPKSELWLQRYQQQLQGMYGFGFGAALDFFAGSAKRAPHWVQRVGMEWLWRLLSNPRRLAKRYLIDSWAFVRIAFTEYRLAVKEIR